MTASGALQGRGGLGSIYVWASGDGGQNDDCNCDGYAASMWTISINSATNDGQTASYDESCSSTLASTFSNGKSGYQDAGVVPSLSRLAVVMGVDQWEQRERVPQNLEWGTLMQTILHILSYFKISITRLLASQCNKKLTNPITVTAYSLLPKSASSVSTKSPLQAENSTFFLTGAGKNAAQNSSKRAISRELFF